MLIWNNMSEAVKITAIEKLRDAEYTQTQIAITLGTSRENIKKFCARRSIIGWKRGAQIRNKNAQVDGQGRNTIMRLTKKVILNDHRSLYQCEKCSKISVQELPRHHKDRNRANNIASNIEVICSACHAKEHLAERTRGPLGYFV